jgi:ribonuclease Z
MEIRPLGTSAALPTRERHVAAVALVRENRSWILFDAGDGAQYRIQDAGLKLRRLEAIFVSHLHGEHIFGIPGILGSSAMLEREEDLWIAGPADLKDFIESSTRTSRSHLGFALRFVALESSASLSLSATERVSWQGLEHGVPCWGFRWQEAERKGSLEVEKIRAEGLEPGPLYAELKKDHDVALPNGRILHARDYRGAARSGRSFAYCTDTRPCAAAVDLARNVDWLCFESTYGSEHADLARARGHSTAAEAARVAREAAARSLLLTHFSSRYADTSELLTQAREIFRETFVANDLGSFPIRHREIEVQAETHAS